MLSFLIVFSESFDIYCVVKSLFSRVKGTHRAQKRHRKLRSLDNITFDRPGLLHGELKETEDNIIYLGSRKMSVNCHFRLRTYYTNIHFNRVYPIFRHIVMLFLNSNCREKALIYCYSWFNNGFLYFGSRLLSGLKQFILNTIENHWCCLRSLKNENNHLPMIKAVSHKLCKTS